MSTEFIEGYLAAIELLLLLLTPCLLILTVYSWMLAFRRKPYLLPVILAVSNSIVGAGATYLSWTILYRSRVGPVPNEFLPATATAVLGLCIAPFLTTMFLAILESRRR